ncbi:ABC transporter substrate-binding protein [Pelosinus sp. sgz500959]|uniref:ABC transporter substrate-binding protein n=1 Tax=Pelosinus sp. sgz500959 TaxID=3242472 RepID=UPI0036726B93
MKRKLIYLAFIISMISLIFSGCSSQAKEKAITQTSTEYLRITDDAGRTVALPQKPQRIVVLSTSFLDVLYGVGGQAVGRPSSKSPAVFPASQNASEIGFIYNVNNEQVLALQPDLVIGFQGIHEKIIPILESSKIPVVMLKMKTFDDIIAKIKLFGDIVGTQSEAQHLIDNMQVEINKVIAKLPAQSKKVVILHATAKNVTVELDNSIAGNIAKMLKIKNIASGSKPLESDPDIAPYSLEKLVEGDADAILVVTMGNMTDIEKRMKSDIASNPAWAGLRAVKNDQIFFLPSELFQLNPGIRFHESVEYMAKVIYPEVYGNVK